MDSVRQDFNNRLKMQMMEATKGFAVGVEIRLWKREQQRELDEPDDSGLGDVLIRPAAPPRPNAAFTGNFGKWSESGQPSMRRLSLSRDKLRISGPNPARPSPPHSVHARIRGGGQGRAASARRQGSLDGRCGLCDFETLEAKEPDDLDGFQIHLPGCWID